MFHFFQIYIGIAERQWALTIRVPTVPEGSHVLSMAWMQQRPEKQANWEDDYQYRWIVNDQGLTTWATAPTCSEEGAPNVIGLHFLTARSTEVQSCN